MPAPARNRGHRLAAYRQCWADPWCWIGRDVVEAGVVSAVASALECGLAPLGGAYVGPRRQEQRRRGRRGVEIVRIVVEAWSRAPARCLRAGGNPR